MKLIRFLAVIATAVLMWRALAHRLGAQLRSMSHPFPGAGWVGRARTDDKRFSIERHSSAASASGGHWRDDRDVLPPVTSPVHEEELTGR